MRIENEMLSRFNTEAQSNNLEMCYGHCGRLF